MRVIIPATPSCNKFRFVVDDAFPVQTHRGKAMTDTLDDLLSYYGAPELFPLAEELIAAKAGIDAAFERWEAANKAIAEGWRAIEERRAALSEAAE
jgi:hypothetical protein